MSGHNDTNITTQDTEDRGQVGIGTLIVFIAMVLVAAIAAGVLINTAGFLQTQAEATGEESTQQVSDRLQIVSQSGYLNDPSAGDVDHLQFVVAQSPCASNIDLDEVSAELIGADGQETIQLDDSAATIDIFTGGSNNVLTDNGDRAEVSIALTTDNDIGVAGGDELGYALAEGDSLSVSFTTASGASTTAEIRIPSTVVENSVRL